MELPDGSTGQTDAGPDASVSPFACPGPATRVTPGSLPYTLTAGALSLRITLLSEAADFTLCAVSEAEAPPSSARLGDAFFLDTSAADFVAEAVLTLDGDWQALLDEGDGSIVVAALAREETGSSQLLADGLLDLEAARVSGTLTEAGFVALRHLDVAARHLARFVPPGDAFVTGALIALESTVRVSGTPALARALVREATGCQLEAVGPEGSAGAPGCETVIRAAGPLGADATLALTGDAAAQFFCTRAGQGELELALGFERGATRELTLRGRAEVQCSQGLDLFAVSNQLRINRLQHGPAFVSVAPYGTALPLEEITLTSDVYLAGATTLGSDGLMYQDLGGARSLGGAASIVLTAPNNAATATLGGDSYGTSYRETSLASREPQYDPASIELPYFPDAGGTLTAEVGAASLAADATGLEELALRIGTPDRANTTLSFADGAAELVVVQGVVRSGSVVSANGFTRFLHASDLPLAEGRRSFPMVTSEQNAALSEAGLGVTHLRVGFYRVTWDEERVLWPGGRILPLAAGVTFEVALSRLYPEVDPRGSACPTELRIDPGTGCQAGPREVLAVAVGAKVETFDPLDGHGLGTLFDAGDEAPEGLVGLTQGGTDGCVYASRHSAEQGDAVLRFDQAGTLLGSFTQAGMTPEGLASIGPYVFIANTEGGLPYYDMRASFPPGPPLETYDPGESVRGAAVRRSLCWSTADGDLRCAGESDIVDVAVGLDGAEQVAFDAADTANVLVALSTGHAIAAYSTGGSLIRYVDDLYTSEAPRGVWPLLNDHWLVAGAGVGVDVVMPGTHVRSKTDTTTSADAAHIARLCLPE